MGVDKGLQNVIQELLLFNCIVFVWMISWTIIEARSPPFINLIRNTEAVLTSTHNLYFRAKVRKMYTPVNPSFTK